MTKKGRINRKQIEEYCIFFQQILSFAPEIGKSEIYPTKEHPTTSLSYGTNIATYRDNREKEESDFVTHNKENTGSTLLHLVKIHLF